MMAFSEWDIPKLRWALMSQEAIARYEQVIHDEI